MDSSSDQFSFGNKIKTYLVTFSEKSNTPLRRFNSKDPTSKLKITRLKEADVKQISNCSSKKTNCIEEEKVVEYRKMLFN